MKADLMKEWIPSAEDLGVIQGYMLSLLLFNTVLVVLDTNHTYKKKKLKVHRLEREI